VAFKRPPPLPGAAVLWVKTWVPRPAQAAREQGREDREQEEQADARRQRAQHLDDEVGALAAPRAARA
jgi:hypothetical protein